MYLKIFVISLLGAFFIVCAKRQAGGETSWHRDFEAACTKTGYMCKTCYQLSYCVELAPGNWLQTDVRQCEDGATCLQSTANCTTQSNPDCRNDDYEFICNQPGIFPDPYDCFRFHICPSTTPALSISRYCTGGFYYDPMTTLCRLPNVNGSCSRSVPDCTAPNQSGAVLRNPSLFYICQEYGGSYHPQIFKCLHGMVYNGTVCVEKATPAPAAGADGKCLAYGYFYDPSNCHDYFTCGAVGSTPLHHSCATKYYFNTTAARCIDFVCTDFNPWRF